MCCADGCKGLLKWCKLQKELNPSIILNIEHITYFNVIEKGLDKYYNFDAEELRHNSYLCDDNQIILKINNKEN